MAILVDLVIACSLLIFCVGDLLSDITSELTLEDAMMHVNHFLL
ncbi:hypothetical protein GYH30_050822 [Glycine max]|nr:hypothetical protein GYH30_050822 [Glycine max]